MKTAFRFSLMIFVLFGLVYPLLVTGLGQLFFPHQANGSLIQNTDGQVVGSPLLGQAFIQPQYFHPRPSANGYDAANSGGSNYGATSKKLIERVTTDAKHYRDINQAQTLPLDAVTASASGLDPHISIENALAQVPRVSKVRGLTRSLLEATIHQNSECHFLNRISDTCNIVNVLKLNLALDDLSKNR